MWLFVEFTSLPGRVGGEARSRARDAFDMSRRWRDGGDAIDVLLHRSSSSVSGAPD